MELPVGVTALEFVDSNMFKKDKNWLFVADAHNGKIYKFRFNPDRTSFIFETPHLQDNILNLLASPPGVTEDTDITTLDYNTFLVESMDEIVLGKNFGIISDMAFGPDGSLYVISFLDGTIYKISS